MFVLPLPREPQGTSCRGSTPAHYPLVCIGVALLSKMQFLFLCMELRLSWEVLASVGRHHQMMELYTEIVLDQEHNLCGQKVMKDLLVEA